MKPHDPLDALIATAKEHDRPPDGAVDQAWAAFVGGGGGGGSDLPTGGEIATAAGAQAGMGLALKSVAALALVSATVVGVARWSAPPAESSTEPAGSAPLARRSADPEVARPRPSDPAGGGLSVDPVVAPSPLRAPAAPLSGPSGAGLVADRRPVPPRRAEPADPEPTPPQPIAPGSASTLAEEARLVGSMWKALDRGDARRALVLARSHGTRFANGALRVEARAAGLAARCQLGRPTNLLELQSVRREATPAVAKRISTACGKNRDVE